MFCVCFSVCSVTWFHLPRAGPAVQEGQGSDHREDTCPALGQCWELFRRMWKSLGSSDQLTDEFYILKHLLVYSSENQLVKVKDIFLEVLGMGFFACKTCWIIPPFSPSSCAAKPASSFQVPGQPRGVNVLGGTLSSIS